MGFLNNWISGCSNTPSLLDAIVMFVARLMDKMFAAVLDIVNVILSKTVLSTAGSQTMGKTATSIGATLDGAAVALMAALVIWSVLSSGEELMTKGRWDGLQGLAGRTGSALLWMVGAGVAIPLLIMVNNDLVTGFTHLNIQDANTFAYSCHDVFGKGTASGVILAGMAGSGAVVFLALGAQVLFLLLLVALIYVFWQWLSRLAEILFWGSLLPIAAATLVTDTSRQMFNYVWRNVQGAIFTQAAMALGIYVMEQAVFFPKTGSGLLLNMLVLIAGFFLVAKIPQYFKEMHGHSTSGGFDAAKGAAAILMARGVGDALNVTPVGQFTGRAMQSLQTHSDQHLRNNAGFIGRTWHKMGQNVTLGKAASNFDQARYEATPGVEDLNYNADAMRETHAREWSKDQEERWGQDNYAPGQERAFMAARLSGFPPDGSPGGSAFGGGSGRGGGRPGGFMPGGGGVYASGPRRGPSGSAGGGMPSGTVTVENFDSAAGAWEAGPVMAAGAIPLGQGPDPAAFASRMPATSHAVGDPLATRGDQQLAGQPNLSADAFAQRNADKMRDYLRHVVQPNTIAATAFQPAEQVAKMAQLQQHYRTLGWPGQEATATFAKLSGVSVEQLNDPMVQKHIEQDLAVKQWGGSLHANDKATRSLEHPLSNTGVQAIQTDEITRNFAASPREASRYLNRLKDRKAAQAAAQAREAGWRS